MCMWDVQSIHCWYRHCKEECAPVRHNLQTDRNDGMCIADPALLCLLPRGDILGAHDSPLTNETILCLVTNSLSPELASSCFPPMWVSRKQACTLLDVVLPQQQRLKPQK
jgi:hypothetical protein